jgi:hypothetical protein
LLNVVEVRRLVFALIIWGWTTRRCVLRNGRFHCPSCASEQNFQDLESRRWFTLFFLPLIPFGSHGRSRCCGNCGASFPDPDAEVISGNQRPSARALIALLCALLSPFAICLLFASIPLALLAIVLGHWSLRDIRRNAPRLQGRRVAVSALVIGYPILMVSLLLAAFVYFYDPAENGPAMQGGPIAATQGGPSERLKSIEYNVAAKRQDEPGTGNSAMAVRLANAYGGQMLSLSEKMFTESKKPLLQLSDGEFLTHCELNPGHCLFVVHVPAYRKYSDDARDLLAELAWTVADGLAAEHLQPGDRLAVALRGTFLYGDIMVGSIAAGDEVAAFEQADKEALYAFLKPSTEPQVVQRDETSSPESAPDKNEATGNSTAPAIAANPNLETAPPDETPQPSSEGVRSESTAAGGLMRGSFPGAPPRSVSTAPKSIPPSPRPSGVAAAVPPRPGSIPNPLQPERSRPENGEMLDRVMKPTPRSSKRTRLQTFLDEFENQVVLKVRRQIENDSWGFRGLAFTPDGNELVATKIDSNVFFYAVDDGAVHHTFKHDQTSSQPELIACSHDGTQLLYGGRDEVYAYPVGSNPPVEAPRILFSSARRITGLVASGEYPFAMVGTNGGELFWQPIRSDGPVRSIAKLERKPLAIGLPVGAPHARATDGRSWIEFSLRDGSLGKQAETGVRYARLGAFSNDADRLVLANGSDIHLIDLDAGSAAGSVQAMQRESVWAVVFHPDGRRFITGHRGFIAVWDFNTASPLAVLDLESIQYIKHLAVSPDGRTLAATSGSSRQPLSLISID